MPGRFAWLVTDAPDGDREGTEVDIQASATKYENALFAFTPSCTPCIAASGSISLEAVTAVLG